MLYFQVYEEYLDGHMLVLERLDTAFKQNNRFEQLYRDFETQRVCYLPLTTFVLKPLHRLLHYQALLQSKLLLFYLSVIFAIIDSIRNIFENAEKGNNLSSPLNQN